jgi:hypothetical protein
MSEGEKKASKSNEKQFPFTVFAEDMSDEWSKDAVKTARDAFALTIATGDVHATIGKLVEETVL